MFEIKTSMHAIPYTQLLLYYIILFTLYLLFLRNVKPTLTTMVIILLFNQGFILLIDDQGLPTKVLFILLSFAILFKARLTDLKKSERLAFGMAIIFAILFYVNYVYSGVSLLWASYQYYKYFVPLALYFGIRGLNLSSEQARYYAELIIKLMWFQIAFSVVKLIIMGFRENITGSISDTGGNIGITFAVCSLILYWIIKGKYFSGRDWWFVFLVLIIPVASNKRAIWFLYPIVLLLLLTDKINERTLRKIAIVMMLMPLIVYVGLRLNPTLNPERKLWGSYNPQYALDYALSYSGVSEEKMESDLAQGRWGTTIGTIGNVLVHPFSQENLIGFARARSGRLDFSEFDSELHGLARGTMLSGIAMMLLQFGWPAALALLMLYLMLIKTVQDRRLRTTLSFFIIWDTFFYSGTVINTTAHAVILVFTILTDQRLSIPDRSKITAEGLRKPATFIEPEARTYASGSRH